MGRIEKVRWGGKEREKRKTTTCETMIRYNATYNVHRRRNPCFFLCLYIHVYTCTCDHGWLDRTDWQRMRKEAAKKRCILRTYICTNVCIRIRNCTLREWIRRVNRTPYSLNKYPQDQSLRGTTSWLHPYFPSICYVKELYISRNWITLLYRKTFPTVIFYENHVLIFFDDSQTHEYFALK